MRTLLQRPTTPSPSPTRGTAWYWWVGGAMFAIGTTAVSCSCQRERSQAERPDKTPLIVERESEPPFELTANVPTEECGERRRLALRTNSGDCPGTGGKVPMERGPLSMYCVYERPANATGDQWGPPGPDRIDDCPVYVQANERLVAAREMFEREVGLVPSTQMPSGLFTGSVDIAVIDTAGTNVSAGKSDHGPLMASIVRDLSGGCLSFDARCMRTVRTYPGLPLSLNRNRVEVRDPARGGYYGTTLDVATAIIDAVDEEPQAERLIINLSLAWFDANPIAATLNPVYVALQYAACNGALIVVAAGNRPLNSCNDNTVPIYPAGWAGASRLGTEACASFDSLDLPGSDGGLEDTLLPELWAGMAGDQERAPLLYPISAVDREGAPLLNSSNQTKWAAYAYRAVGSIQRLDSTRWLGPMSGTSVSTAVVSGIAALVWSARPTLEPEGVMSIIWDVGDYFGPDGAPSDQQQHVAMACKALQSFCGNEDEVCLPECPSAPKVPEMLVAEFVAAKVAVPRTVSRLIEPIQAPEIKCARERLAVVTPQPDVPVCPSCSIEPYYVNAATNTPTNAKLNLQLASEYSGFVPINMRVTLYSSRTSGSVSEVTWYTIDNVPPTATGAVSVTATQMSSYDAPDLNFVGSGDLTPARAWVEIYFTDPKKPGTAPFSVGNDLDIQN